MIPGSPGGLSDSSVGAGSGGVSPGNSPGGSGLGGAGGPAASVYATNLRNILQNDTVHSTDLRLFLNQKMAEAKAAVGDAPFDEAVSAVEPAILMQLQKE